MPQILQQMKSVEKLNDLGYLEGEVVLVKLAFSATYGTSKEGGLISIKTGFFF